MMRYAILLDEDVIGFTERPEDLAPGLICLPVPAGTAPDDALALRDGVLVVDAALALAAAKSARVTRIKQEAAARISALDWRLDRAREREAAGMQGVETVLQVLASRETIRTLSGAAEKSVGSMTSIQSVRSFGW